MKNKLRNSILLVVLLVGSFASFGKLYGMFFQQPYSMPTAADVPFFLKYARVDTAFFNQPNYVAGLGATRTLLANESGSTIDFDRAAGIVVTLPAPAEGLYYNFVVSVSVTSNAYKLATGTQGTDWFTGGIVNVDTDTSDALASFRCDGTSHDNFSMNGTTTGGLIGSRFKVTAVSSTLWLVEGFNHGSGTVATSCATS